VRDIFTAKEVLNLKLKGRIASLSFSPDGELLTASIGDEQVKIWNVSTGKEHVPSKPAG
jgi:WD40 repeat protein